MSIPFKAGRLPGVLSLALLIGAASADDRMSSRAGETDERVARLEALLEAQQRQIEAMEQQLAAASAQDEDTRRVEVMSHAERAASRLRQGLLHQEQ
jgi:hypothetical protein